MMVSPIVSNFQGQGRKRLMQMHRLLEFQRAFDGYLAGRVSMAYVTARAKKMLEIGLPKLSK